MRVYNWKFLYIQSIYIRNKYICEQAHMHVYNFIGNTFLDIARQMCAAMHF